MEAIKDARGLWRRTIYRRADDVLDDSTEVLWLQGPRFFADMRQPKERISFADAGCLRELNEAHMAWLASQQAFAGVLQLNGADAWWQRSIDLQPKGHIEDRARLSQSGDVLDEYGTESPYYEQWQRQARSSSPCWGMSLSRMVDDRRGFLIRAGDKMIFARGRHSSLPPGRTLTGALTMVSRKEKQDLLDFEVSLGSLAVDECEWSIERSTLPFKAGMRCAIRRHDDGAGVIELDDVDCEGRRCSHAWRILEADVPQAAAEFSA